MDGQRIRKSWPLSGFSRIWFISSLALLILSPLRIFPAIFLATRLSDNQVLTATYTSYLERAQWTFALLMLALWPLTFAQTAMYQTRQVLLRKLPDPLFLFGLVGFAFGATLLVQFYLFQDIPHVTDAITHLFQARILGLGRLWASAPPCFEHFYHANLLITRDGRWFAAYPPGHALTLLAALKCNLLPLYGPFMTSSAILACTWIVRRFHGRSFSRAWALLAIQSPFILLMGASYMSHLSLVTCVSMAIALGLHGFDRAEAHQRSGPWMAGAGFFMGMSVLIRPQDLALLMPAMLLGGLCCWRRTVPVFLRSLPAIAIGLALPLGFQLYWNHHVLGSALVLGYGRTDVGALTHLLTIPFGLRDGFTFRQATQQMIWLVSRLDSVLLGWPTALPFILLACRIRSPDRRDTISLATFALAIAVYFTYRYYGREYEARYFFFVAPFAMVLVLRGLQRLHEWMPSRMAVPMVVLLLTLFGWIHYWPRYVIPNYGRDYELTSPILPQLARESGLTEALVLVDAGDIGNRYSSGMVHNDPWLENAVIYARDLPGNQSCLARSFPERAIYRFIPNDDWTGGSFVLLTPPQPLPASESQENQASGRTPP